MNDANNLTPAQKRLPNHLRFTLTDAERAFDEWGANCGPGALAAVLGLTLAEVRPHLDGFNAKRYTNPTMMFSALRSIGARFSYRGGDLGHKNWPNYGLARVQWEGPWTAPNVPARVAYRHTHWVGAFQGAKSVGGVPENNGTKLLMPNKATCDQVVSANPGKASCWATELHGLGSEILYFNSKSWMSCPVCFQNADQCICPPEGQK